MATKKKINAVFAAQTSGREVAIKKSSPRLSTLAEKILRRLEDHDNPQRFRDGDDDFAIVKTKDLKALCASVLSQDEVRGQKS